MPEKNPFLGATFAERKAIREAAEKAKPATSDQDEKQVRTDEGDVEDKAVRPSSVKRPRAKKKA